MSCDYLPPGTSDRDADAPWNAEDFDGAEFDHGIDQVCGGDAESTAETFAQFTSFHINSDKQELLCGNTTRLSPTPSNDDLLKIILSSRKPDIVYAAASELRARYLSTAYTKEVIEQHADAWVLDRRTAMSEGA